MPDPVQQATPRSPAVPRRWLTIVSSRAFGTGTAAAACVLIAAFSLWYVSAGHFPAFPDIQNDYVDLGEAFLRGQLSLLEEPNAALATLENPYDFKQRRKIPYHWDASYFDGKYFLYWGPIPGLASAALEVMGGAPPAASLLVVLPFLLLLPIVLALLLHLARGHPSAAANPSIWLFIVLAFFSFPLLFVIGQPRHYQASILYGQLFLLVGLLAFARYTRVHRVIWLAVAGLGWGLAVLCRYNLVISAAIGMLFALFWIWRERAQHQMRPALAALFTSAGLCGLALGAYDFARFGNPLETGLSYQLTIPEFHQVSYSTAYVPSNIYLYLAYPLAGSPEFPFIQAAHFRPALLPAWSALPDGREVDQVMFGLLSSVPAIWLFLVTLPAAVLALRSTGGVARGQDGNQSRFWLLLLGAIVFGQFAFLMVFFYAAERYVADFYLPLILCLAILVWSLDNALVRFRALRVVLWILVVLLVFWSAAIGYFSCFGVPNLVSYYFEPLMIRRLAFFWNSVRAAVFFGGP